MVFSKQKISLTRRTVSIEE